ncbi:MAG TPA: AAA family ATPase, partial [Polyangia bacterium]|nr:AAA family ATPase [Polyangia bacterium]
ADRERLALLESELHERVIGQDDAVVAVAKAVRRNRTGLGDRNRPVGSFLFLGPTGVGKTELAKTLASSLFGDEKAMLRFDMSEFGERHTVARLVGAPPGYVGYDEAGQLTERVRRNPYSVILFDEIEKAHADVFSLLLQVLDDGRLTDGQGRTVDFRNTVVIMTSNAGSHLVTDVVEGADAEALRKKVLEELRHTFRPEFLNRVDDIVVFHRLLRAELDRIVDLQLERLRKLLRDRDLELALEPAARTFLADEGYDPVYGARPLKRAITHHVQDPLARRLLAGEFAPGDTIVVDRGAGGDKDALTFARRRAKTLAAAS